MNTPLVSRNITVLLCVLAAASGSSQELRTLPPRLDPTFWGRPNEPYILKVTSTSTTVDPSDAPRQHSAVAKVYRDSEGRVRTDSFYDSGKPMSVSIEDPVKRTFTLMKVVDKTVVVLDPHWPAIWHPEKVWTVERLPSRVIDGIPAEGLRFTRTIPAQADGSRPSDMIVEEDWLSDSLGVVLERTVKSQHTGTTTTTVSDFQQVEPDPALFTVPSDYRSLPTAQPSPQR